jgi:acetyl esterase/lipase
MNFILLPFLIGFLPPVETPIVVPVWPGKPPGDENLTLPQETAETKTDKPPSITRISNVSTPTLHVFKPDPAKDTGASVVICPGGGHRILAWDLEGTEVAAWLNSLGVTGIVLKYRVPGRDKEMQGKAAVQDAQRAVSLVRSKAEEWKLDPKRIGVLGFSAGGEVAALTTLFDSNTNNSIYLVINFSYHFSPPSGIYPAC